MTSGQANSLALVETELAKLLPDLRQLAEEFGKRFDSTYGTSAYKSAKLIRDLDLPADLPGHAWVHYIQLVFNATYLRDRFQCAYCGRDGLLSGSDYALMSIDHLVPVSPSDGDVWSSVPLAERIIAANGPENLACACRRCNSAKGDSVLGLTLAMSRRERITTARTQLQRWNKPHRYDTEFQDVAKFLSASDRVLASCG